MDIKLGKEKLSIVLSLEELEEDDLEDLGKKVKDFLKTDAKNKEIVLDIHL